MRRPRADTTSPSPTIYGLRSRLARVRREAPDAWPLVRWIPPEWFTDPWAIASLCTPWEMAWVTRHLATEYDGDGAVVELGTWLGDISRAIGAGLSRNGDRAVRRTKAHVYDTFRFVDIEERLVGTPLEGSAHDGDSFQGLHARRTARHAGNLEVHAGDVRDESWPPDRPIAFVFNDLSKTWDTWDHVRSTFVRALREGGLLVEQDWAHACTPWLHLWHHRYRDHFEVLGQVPHSSTVAFRLRRLLPDRALEPERLDDYRDDEIRAAFDWSAGLVDPMRRSNVRGAFVHVYSLHGSLEQALDTCVSEIDDGHLSGELASTAVPELLRRLHAHR